MSPEVNEAPVEANANDLEASVNEQCIALAELIVEAIEYSLRLTDGRRTHAPESDEPDLIPFLFHDTTES